MWHLETNTSRMRDDADVCLLAPRERASVQGGVAVRRHRVGGLLGGLAWGEGGVAHPILGRSKARALGTLMVQLLARFAHLASRLRFWLRLRHGVGQEHRYETHKKHARGYCSDFDVAS